MLRLVMESAKCTHLYHYYQHPEIGLMHIRVQTWFPFSVDVCLNGRQWLARQLDRAGIDYQQRDNCFICIEDCAAAQQLLDEQLRSNWPALMNSFLEIAHPLHGEITAPMADLSYYWSASQSEYATDVLFDQAEELQKLDNPFDVNGRRLVKEFTQKATKDAKRWGTNSEGQVKYCRGTLFGHATPDRAGARPYRVQCRVARCDMDLPAHTSHPLSRLFACFAGPIP